MAQFTIHVPDGRKLTIEAADQGAAIAGAQDWVSKNPPQQPGQQAAPAPTAPGQPSPAPAGAPSLLGSTVSTLNHAVTDLPVIGPALQWTSDNLLAQTVGRMSGQEPDQWLKEQQAKRTANDAANPIAAIGGGLVGNVAAAALTGGTTAGADALGMAGGLGKQVVNSGLSTLGLTTADNMVRGQKPTDALANAAGPAALAAGIPVVGNMVGKGMQKVADVATSAAQRSATNSVIKNAPAAADLRSAASQAFEAATGGNPIAISDNAIMRFAGDVQRAERPFRITPDNEPGSNGLLKKLMSLADSANTPGVVVDMKDLHKFRQSAWEVGQSKGADGLFGRTVVNELDKFIKTLSPSDILGGTSPTQAATDLMTGISGWSRASKVGIIEGAIKKADGYPSGLENGLRLQFGNLMRSKDFDRFSAAEQQAIRDVAKGSTKQNIAKGIGKLGFSFGGTAGNNILGGLGGAALSTAALTPLLGPVAPYVGPAASMAVSAAGRNAAERMGVNAANRAAQVVATPGIPSVARKAVPPMLTNGLTAAEMLARGLLLTPSLTGRQ